MLKFFIAFALLLCIFVATTLGHNGGNGGNRFFFNAPRNVIRNDDNNLPSCKSDKQCPTGSYCDTVTGDCHKKYDG